MLISLSSLIWLESIYGQDLGAFPNPYPFATDLRPIAEAILADHDSCYDCGGERCAITSTEIPTQSKLLEVYPNPATGTVYIHHYAPSLAPKTIQIYNATGQLIQSQPLQAEVTPIRNLKPGMYWAFVAGSNGERQLLKFIVN